MRQILLLFMLIGLISYSVSAQESVLYRSCASQDAINDFLKKNFDITQFTVPNHDHSHEKTSDYTVPTVNTDTTYTVQVVVHVVYLADNEYENIPDQYIYSQIDALNRDFNLLNGDTTKIRPEFRQFVGNPKVKFELAKVDPQGNPTTGITRKKGTPVLIPDWNPVFNNVKNTAQGGRSPWKTSQYLNIWVCDLNINSRKCKTCVDVCDTCGLLGGYAQPPRGLPNWVIDLGTGPVDASAAFSQSTDGVVIDFRFFGQFNPYNRDYLNGSDRYGQGRTTVHEVGHYLGLRHTWGDYGTLLGDGCAFDDGIADTPNEAAPYANSITSAADLCVVAPNGCVTPFPGDGVDYPDNFENYMDYATDACYAMFTLEQVNMMRYALTNKRTGIITDRAIGTPIFTGVKNISAENNGIDIFPNPSRGSFNVRRNGIVKNETVVEIFNMLGEVVSTQKIAAGAQSFTVNTANLLPAVYFVRFSYDNISTTERILIQ